MTAPRYSGGEKIIDLWESIARSREASGRFREFMTLNHVRRWEDKKEKETKYSSQEAKGTRKAKEGNLHLVWITQGRASVGRQSSPWAGTFRVEGGVYHARSRE